MTKSNSIKLSAKMESELSELPSDLAKNIRDYLESQVWRSFADAEQWESVLKKLSGLGIYPNIENHKSTDCVKINGKGLNKTTALKMLNDWYEAEAKFKEAKNRVEYLRHCLGHPK